MSKPQATLIRGGTLVDVEAGSLESADVLIREGRIAGIGQVEADEGAEVYASWA